MAALAEFIGLLGIALFITGLVALAKGSVRHLGIFGRQQGGLVLLGALLAITVGALLAPPKAKQVNASSSPLPAPSAPEATPSGSASAPQSGATATPSGSPGRSTAASPGSPRASGSVSARPGATTSLSPGAPGPSCSASMSNPTPALGGSDTVDVSSDLPNSAMSVTLHFRSSSTTHNTTTDASGTGSVSFGIGRPTAGLAVTISVNIGGRASCSTAFTPQ